MTKSVAVVVPVTARERFTDDEELSLKHLETFLGSYDRFFIAPPKSPLRRPGFEIRRFADRFFGSAAAHARLLLTAHFYESFRDYRYILMHHLDALVFSDELGRWCDRGFDYIGAPWLRCNDTPFVTVPRVGNGGLSLRKVESFLAVLNSSRYWVDPEEYWRQLRRTTDWSARCVGLAGRYLKRLRALNNARTEIGRMYLGKRNEDYFWSDAAVRYHPGFRVAPFEMGLQFAFEVAPRFCFALNGGRLPFGCHAWSRYDPTFWEPYLLR